MKYQPSPKSLENLKRGWESRHPNKLANLKLGGFKKGHSGWLKGKTENETPTWKGEGVGYSGLHIWVKKCKGKAKICTRCKSIKFVQWANIDHKYKRDLSNFVSLCASCHRKYDYGYIEGKEFLNL